MKVKGRYGPGGRQSESASWPQVAANVVDVDPALPNRQWIDATNDVSPSGTWYYRIAPYNAACAAEGPFR